MRALLRGVALLAAGAEIALLALGAPPWLLALVHGLLVCGLGGLCRAASASWPMALRLATIALCFPVLGGLAAAWLTPLRPREAQLGVEQAAPRAPRAPSTPPARSSWGLCEALRTGPLQDKLAAAQALAAMPGADGVRALRALLVDDDADNRMVASLGLREREDELEAALKAARERLSQCPSPAAWLERAEAARRYAESTLPTGIAAQELWEEAAQAADEVLTAKATNLCLQARLILSVAYRALGRPAAALEAAEAAAAQAPGEPDAWYQRCACLFALRDFERLGQAAARLAQNVSNDSPQRARADLWRPHAS